MLILGISALYHDSAAALVKDGANHRCGARRTHQDDFRSLEGEVS